MEEARDVEVIVIGSGVAGLAAALTARERGATSVLVAESEGVVGGSSRLSGGLMMGAGTRYQKALGIDDDPDSLFHDYLQLNRWNVDAGVVRRFCELAGPTVEWVGDLGVEFYDTLVFGGEERVPTGPRPDRSRPGGDRRPRSALPGGRDRRCARPAGRPVDHRIRRGRRRGRRRRCDHRRCGGGRHRRVRQQPGEAGDVLPVGGADRVGVVHRGGRLPGRCARLSPSRSVRR